MRNSYKRRPEDFRRRVIARISSGRGDLLAEEYRWLQMIPVDQLGKRYYNLTNHLNGHWSTDDEKRRAVSQKQTGKKLSPETIAKRTATRMQNGYKLSQRTKDKKSKLMTGERNPFYGKQHSEATKRYLSSLNKGKKQTEDVIAKKVATRKSRGYKHSMESNLKRAEAMRRYHAQKKAQ